MARSKYPSLTGTDLLLGIVAVLSLGLNSNNPNQHTRGLSYSQLCSGLHHLDLSGKLSPFALDLDFDRIAGVSYSHRLEDYLTSLTRPWTSDRGFIQQTPCNNSYICSDNAHMLLARIRRRYSNSGLFAIQSLANDLTSHLFSP